MTKTRCCLAEYWTLFGKMVSLHVCDASALLVYLWLFLDLVIVYHGLSAVSGKVSLRIQWRKGLRVQWGQDLWIIEQVDASSETSRIPLLKLSLVKRKQQANIPLKKKTSALWNRGSYVLSLSLIGSRFLNLLSLSERPHVCVFGLIYSFMLPACKAQILAEKVCC